MSEAKPFLKWPSRGAAARELGVRISTLHAWISGRVKPGAWQDRYPGAARAYAELLKLGWEPPAEPLPSEAGGARSVDAAHRAGEVISFETLRSAAAKPAGCSAARWRIELARRRMARRMGDYIDLLPDPAALD